MKPFVPKKEGPGISVSAMNSNTLSDAYRDAITIRYRVIGAAAEPDTAFRIGETEFATPILAGPIGGHDRIHPSGARGFAQGVWDAGSAYWASFHVGEEWAEVMAAQPALRVIKPLADNDRVLEEIRKDVTGGAIGYAMDVDHSINAYGLQDGPNGIFGRKTAEDLRRFNEASEKPFYLKGIMTVEDAVLAAEVGVAGIVISGHNNRLPCAVPPLKVLPEIRAAVGDRLQILVDGGMKNGYDCFKALALGADGILVARALMTAFKEGADGVSDKLLEMTAELKGAMVHTNAASLQDIRPEMVCLP